jgi:hypothetical protein
MFSIDESKGPQRKSVYRGVTTLVNVSGMSIVFRDIDQRQCRRTHRLTRGGTTQE